MALPGMTIKLLGQWLFVCFHDFFPEAYIPNYTLAMLAAVFVCFRE
jgi:hypothetical protein